MFKIVKVINETKLFLNDKKLTEYYLKKLTKEDNDNKIGEEAVKQE